jgi:hypothetical protein
MNKCFLFLAFAVFSVFSCSDDKGPSHEEICKKTPVEKDCLVGKWSFKGVYENPTTLSGDCPEPGVLTLAADGDYNFKGGVHFQGDETIGEWFLEGDSLTAISTNEVGGVYERRGTVTVSNSGNDMEVNTTGYWSVFAYCNTHKLEKFTWQGK